MKIIEWLIAKTNQKSPDLKLEETGYCPNCWGQQSYDKTFKDAVKDKQLDVNNGEVSHAFIQGFVKTHLEPMKLQNHDIYDQCPVCKVKYKRA